MSQKITKQMEQFILQHKAEFEGRATVAWHKFNQECEVDLGDSSENNIYFLCFQAGTCEGGLIANDIWQQCLGINKTNE